MEEQDRKDPATEIRPAAAGGDPPRKQPVVMSVDEEERQKAVQIERESPEGLPAHPETGPRQISFLVLCVAIVLITISVVLGVTVSAWPAVALGGVAALVLAWNPIIWTAILRAQERKHVEEHMAKKRGGRKPIRPGSTVITDDELPAGGRTGTD